MRELERAFVLAGQNLEGASRIIKWQRIGALSLCLLCLILIPACPCQDGSSRELTSWGTGLSLRQTLRIPGDFSAFYCLEAISLSTTTRCTPDPGADLN